MCIHVYICIFIYIYRSLTTYVQTHIYIYVHVYIYVYILYMYIQYRFKYTPTSRHTVQKHRRRQLYTHPQFLHPCNFWSLPQDLQPGINKYVHVSFIVFSYVRPKNFIVFSFIVFSYVRILI